MSSHWNVPKPNVPAETNSRIFAAELVQRRLHIITQRGLGLIAFGLG